MRPEASGRNPTGAQVKNPRGQHDASYRCKSVPKCPLVLGDNFAAGLGDKLHANSQLYHKRLFDGHRRRAGYGMPKFRRNSLSNWQRYVPGRYTRVRRRVWIGTGVGCTLGLVGSIGSRTRASSQCRQDGGALGFAGGIIGGGVGVVGGAAFGDRK